MKQLELWRFESTDAVASAVRLDLGVQKEVSEEKDEKVTLCRICSS
jgi:hypothetical protein